MKKSGKDFEFINEKKPDVIVEKIEKIL